MDHQDEQQRRAAMVNKLWLKSYPAGMPVDIDSDRFSSIPDLLEKISARFADRPAFHNLGGTMSYAGWTGCRGTLRPSYKHFQA
jgi:long-chain acyl-CoA synthetase